MPRNQDSRLMEEFKDRESFTRDELLSFFLSIEPKLSKGTFGWRIYDLKNRNIIRTMQRGRYAISRKSIYTPECSSEMVEIAKQLAKKFSEIRFSIWDTSWLNEFSQLQTSKSMLVIDVEKGFEEALFYELKDNMHQEVFIRPDETAIYFYIAESQRPIIIKKLLTRAPLSQISAKDVEFFTPTLEKVLVDLLAEDKLFHFFQGSELIHIYGNAISKYTINFTKLFSYAKRREREEEIRQFMRNHIPHLVKEIGND